MIYRICGLKMTGKLEDKIVQLKTAKTMKVTLKLEWKIEKSKSKRGDLKWARK